MEILEQPYACPATLDSRLRMSIPPQFPSFGGSNQQNNPAMPLLLPSQEWIALYNQQGLNHGPIFRATTVFPSYQPSFALNQQQEPLIPEPKIRKNRPTCVVCNKEFARKDSLKRHLELSHKRPDLYIRQRAPKKKRIPKESAAAAAEERIQENADSKDITSTSLPALEPSLAEVKSETTGNERREEEEEEEEEAKNEMLAELADAAEKYLSPRKRLRKHDKPYQSDNE